MCLSGREEAERRRKHERKHEPEGERAEPGEHGVEQGELVVKVRETMVL